MEHYATKAQARGGVAAFIDEYNRDRRHSSIGMISPIDYEHAVRAQTAGSEPEQAA
jgi:transposase InsO family protein